MFLLAKIDGLSRAQQNQCYPSTNHYSKNDSSDKHC